MGILDDIMADDASAFLNTDEFGETAIYHNQTTGARSITVAVDRSPPMPIQEAQTSMAPYFHVSVANNATRGISRQELNMGLDTIELKANKGDAQYTTYKIKIIEKQDAGMLLLQVR